MMSTDIASTDPNARTRIPRTRVAAAADDSQPGVKIETKTVGQVTVADAVMTARRVNVHYGEKHAVKDDRR